jgi:sensor histidine kinase YesM
MEIKDKTSGIGLVNVKRRLDLLYGSGHMLSVKQKEDWFTVFLTINLHP